MAVNEPWLAQAPAEAVVDPDLPILDAHHHLWERPPQRPDERYTDEHYLRDALAGHRVLASVFIECNGAYRSEGPEHLRPVGETEAANAMAERCLKQTGIAVAAGIVGFARFQDPAVDETLQAHIAAAPRRFRGIRQTMAWDADERLRYRHIPTLAHQMSDLAWRVGFARLRVHGLSFDSWVYHSQLDEVLALAQAFPDTIIVVDHLGGPLGVHAYADRREAVLADWRRSLAGLASCDNVFLKLGGLLMHCIGLHQGPAHRDRPASSDELVAATGDLYRQAIDIFSPDRCMFESNFPVDKESAPAVALWNSFKKLSAGYSTSERTAMFGGTAAKVYRLHWPGS